MQNNSTSDTPTPNTQANKPVVSKLVFCWLALLTGVVGGQWFFYGHTKRALLYLLFIPFSAFVGWCEVMRFGLMPDEQFNKRFNPDIDPQTPQTNGLVVTAIILSLGVGVVALMSMLAVLFQLVFSGTVA